MATLTARPPTVFARATKAPKAAATPNRRGGIILFTALAALYFAVGYVLMMRYNIFEGDAASRVANAGFALFSRDPHVSAIGFVWNPLPSLVEIPVLPFARWWPELRTHGLAGVVQSALFMAGAVLMVRRIALDRGLGTGWRCIVVVSFALQPMIIVHGASGMSEAAETFCVLWCARYLMRWSDQRRIGDMAWAGIALGVGYLARYEAILGAIGAAVFVGVLATRHAEADRRFATVLAHVAIILFPTALAASIWALTGWVINHELFAIVSSQYGNANTVASAIQRGAQLGGSATEWVTISARLLGMQPFVGIATAGAMAYALLTRNAASLVPVVLIGPVLAFAAWGQYSSTTFGLFRYFLLAVPLVVCITLAWWTPTDIPRPPWATETRAGRVAAVLMCVSIGVGFPVTIHAMLNDHMDRSPIQLGLNSLLHPKRFPSQEAWYRQLMVSDRLLADYFDRQRLPDGAVLMDSFDTWGVWLGSADPKQFLITSDYDFKAALNRPWNYRVSYLLVSNPSLTDADALNIRFPRLWDDGAGFSKLVYSSYGVSNDERFRIYQVTGPPTGPTTP